MGVTEGTGVGLTGAVEGAIAVAKAAAGVVAAAMNIGRLAPRDVPTEESEAAAISPPARLVTFGQLCL